MSTLVTLESLAGLHMLDARGEFVGNKEHDWQDGSPRVVLLRLDGVIYWFQEDPSDGYRSSLSHVRVARPDDIPDGALAAFPERLVSCALRTEPNHDWYWRSEADEDATYGQRRDEVLVGTDEATGTVLFEIGTENLNDYYPSFVSHWTPPEVPR